MSKKIKYGLLIIFIIALAVIAYFIVSNKRSKTEPAKTKVVDVVSTKEQIIEKLNQEQKINQADIAQKIKLAQEDVARRVQEAASSTVVASSTENTNIKLVK